LTIAHWRRYPLPVPSSKTVARIVLLGMAAPGVAGASSWDLYGFGARGASLAGAMTAAGDDRTATYYNPAALLAGEGPRLALGVDWVIPALNIDFDEGAPPLAPNDVGMDVGLHVGLSVPLGGWFERRVAVGLGVHHAADGGTRIETFDPQRPQFFLYQSLPDKVLLAPAVAVEITPWLLVGGGLQVLAFLEGEANASVSLGAHRVTKTGVRVDILARNAPTVGALLRPSESLDVGLTYRHGLDFTYELPLQLEIEEVGTLSLNVAGVALYTPPQADAGVAWRPTPDLLLLAGLTWAGWSHSPDPAADVLIELQGENIGREQLAKAESVPVDLGAQDVLIPRLGAEWTRKDWTLRGGVAFRPTPLPTPTGRTNYIDSSALITGLGASWRWLEVAALATWLSPRSIKKNLATDPVGSYVAGGAVFRLTLGISRSL
jgi:hypothetical protein